jgi:hypothetical protein
MVAHETCMWVTTGHGEFAASAEMQQTKRFSTDMWLCAGLLESKNT